MTAFDVEYFSQLAPQWELEYFSEIDSTSQQARRACANGEARSGQIFLADAQTAGVGRRGTRWSCQPGEGLLFTAILETESVASDLGKFGLATGLAVADVMLRYGYEPELKWPNDVYIKGKKLCGVLVENVGDFTLFGIGVNTHVRTFPEGLNATSLLAEGSTMVPTREEFLAQLMQKLMTRVSCVASQFDQLVMDWTNYDHLLGKSISYVEEGKRKQGFGRGVSSQGYLLVESEGETRELISASQISFDAGP